MATTEHYFVERNHEGKYAVRARDSERASGLFDTQAEAEARAHELNENDHANVERVRHTAGGTPGEWRKK